MQLDIFSIYDTKADSYLQPFFTNNKATAIRTFSDLANQSDHQFCRHAGDYVLFQIGTYDDSRGLVTALTANINLGSALEFQQSVALPTLEAVT